MRPDDSLNVSKLKFQVEAPKTKSYCPPPNLHQQKITDKMDVKKWCRLLSCVPNGIRILILEDEFFFVLKPD